MQINYRYLITCFLLVLLPLQAMASAVISSCSGNVHCSMMQGKSHCCCGAGCLAAIKKNLMAAKNQQKADSQIEVQNHAQSEISLSSTNHDMDGWQSIGCKMNFICAAGLTFLTAQSFSLLPFSHLQEMISVSTQDRYISFIPEGLQRPPQANV